PFGLVQGKTYYFEVKAKDALNNVTEWSTKAMVSLTAPPKTIEVPFNHPDIQSAINAAKNGDTIVIHPGRYPAKGYNQDSANIDWFRGFKVDKNITIRSINPDDPQIVASTIIDCMNDVEMSGGFLLVGDTAVGGGYCELRGLTITNIYIHGGTMSTPALPGMDGHESGVPMFGGGIAIDGNHLVENCVIRDSILIGWHGGDGSDGNDESPYIPISGGKGGNGSDVGGAGIYVAWGSPIIRGTTIQDCQVFAGNGGSGGDGVDAPPEINDPNNPGGRGGDGGNAGSAFGAGVFVSPQAGSPIFEDCIIRNCFGFGGTAGDGGTGGDFADSSIHSPLTDLPGDGSGGHGGVPGSVLGGGIYCGSETVLRNCIIERNYALGGYGGNGGDAGAPSPTTGEGFDGGVGGLLDRWDPYLTEDTPQGLNSPDKFTAKGGGLYAEQGISILIENTEIKGNITRGSVSGLGGLTSYIGEIPIPSRQNYQIASHGGGIAIGSNVTAHLEKSEISQNQTINSWVSGSFRGFDGGVDIFPDGLNPSERSEHVMIDYFGWGGGLYCEGSLNLQIIDCTISGNESPVGGGMAVADIDNINIIRGIISNNTAGYGGGIVNINSVLDINDCIISSNTASTSTGGGIHCTSSSLNMRNSVLEENIAAISGGGIFIQGVNSPTAEQKLTNCLIIGNQAFKSGGGIASRDEAVVTVKNCTVVENTVSNTISGSGGGISCAANNSNSISVIEVVSSILWDNAAKYGSQIAVGDALSQNNPDATVWTRYSDSQGGSAAVFEGITQDPNGGPWSYWATGNINADPIFVRANAKDPLSAYYLSHLASGQIDNSPCINAGKDNASDLFDELQQRQVTTRTDAVADSDRVDMGYHYPIPEEIKMYGLTIEVEVEPGFESDGMLQARLYGDNAFVKQTRNDPCSFYVPQGAIIELTAIPDADFKVDVWTGADRVPAAGDPCNVVTMDSTKKVTVSFTPDGFYYLTTKVTTDNGHIEYFNQALGQMVVHEGRSIHKEGEVVELLAVPDDKSNITHWTGTDDDLAISRENTVTMTSRKDVSVSFSPPRILYVGADSKYPTIQLAINAAISGDIVMITPGTYDIYEASQDEPYLFVSGKDITITSVDPLDANNVTIIGGFVIENVRREMVIEGLTIQAHYSGEKSIGGPYKMVNVQGSGVDGLRGYWGYGGGMWLV
ncbi:MAG: right-handed parallel beta-helix repeat-containing protein, partial [Phycisphaerae bacterium]